MDREELKPYMKAAMMPDIHGEPCPEEEELLPLVHQSSGGAEGAIASHVQSCPHCQQRLKDLADFFDPARDGESITAPDKNRLYADTLRVARAGQRRSFSWGPARAVAASLVVAVWTSVLYQRAEDRNRALEARMGALNNALQLAEAKQSQPVMRDGLVVDAFPVGTVDRSGGLADRTVRAPAGKALTLLLHLDRAPATAAYSGVLKTSSGTIVSQLTDVKIADGVWIVILGTGLAAGDYILELKGTAGSVSYRLTITESAPVKTKAAQ